MNPLKFRMAMDYLTRIKKVKPDLPDVFPASRAPIPPKKKSLETMEAINRFVRDNPRQDMAGGGMLVQPGFGGVRQGYADDDNGRRVVDDDDGRRVTDKKRLKQLDKETELYTDGKYKTWNSLPDDRKLRATIGKNATLRAQGKNIGGGKGQPGVSRPVGEDFVSPMKDARVAAKQRQTKKIQFQTSPVGERLQWIANNGKNYNNTKDFIKAYEKHFKHKIGSKTDALFNTAGKKALTQIDNLVNTGRSQDLFTLTFIDGKAFNQKELFKASIIQNNPEIKKQFKELFKQVHNNVGEFSELGPESLVERLNKGKLLKEFDFVKFGVGSGITRNSLLNVANVKPEHLNSFKNVRKPVLAIAQIMQNLKNPSFAKGYGISPATATKIRGQLDNFLEGEKNLVADIRKVNNQLGDVKFNQIFGGVNFEHTLAKQFGKDYKYLPRNYLLKGQFTTKAFNMFKKDAFDLPLIGLMKQYEKGKVTGEQVQKFINDFNAKTNNYADFNFNVAKGKLEYADNAVKYDLSRYNNPDVARQELIKNIDLTMSPEFQRGFKNLPQARDQLKLFRSKDAKNIRNLIAALGGGDCGTTGFLNQGGRVGLQNGTTSVNRCFRNALERIRKGGVDFTKAEAMNFNKLTKSLRAAGASNIVKFGILPEVLFEGAFVADKMASEGDTFAQALRNSYLAIPFQAMGLAKTYEEGEKDRILAAAPESQRGKILDVFNMQEDLNKKIELMGASEGLKEQIAATDAVSDEPLGYVGDSQDLQKRLFDTRADLQDLYRGDINRTERILTSSPLDLNIQDQLTMDAFKSATEKADADKASNILLVPGAGQGVDVQIKKRMKELPVTPEVAKQQLQATGDFYGMGYTPLGLNQLFTLMGGDDPRFGYDETGKYSEEKGLTDYMNYLKTQNIADAGGVANLAGGGIAKIAGVDSGPPPASGPNSQGLQGLMKRVKRI